MESSAAARIVEASDDAKTDFETLFKHHYPTVLRFFSKCGCTIEEGNDLTQETFLRAYRSIEAFRGDASHKTWLLTIAANVWRNWLRSRNAGKRDAPEVSLEALDEHRAQGTGPRDRFHEVPGPLAMVLAQERIGLLHEALDELPPQMRRCVMLRLGSELKYREIAILMELSIETVKSQLHQARRRLRGRLTELLAERL